MATRSRSSAPQASIAPVVVLVGLGVAGFGFYRQLPGLVAVWFALVVAAWSEPSVVLTGRKDSSGYPTPANPAEERRLNQYRTWRDLKVRLILPGGDIMSGWPLLWSWLFAAMVAGLAAFAPVKLPGYRLLDAAAAFLVVTVSCAARRRALGTDHPGTRVDALGRAARAGHLWLVLAVFATAVGVGADLALRAAFAKWPSVAAQVPTHPVLYALVPVTLATAALGYPLREAALAEWRELVAARAQYATRWMALKRDPAPVLIKHETVGAATLDTFEAPGHEGSMTYLPLGPKIAPTYGAGTRVAVLECPDEGPEGPIAGSVHPLRFQIAVWPVADLPHPEAPDARQAEIELFARCAAVWALEPLGYARLCLAALWRLTPEPMPAPGEGTGRPEAGYLPLPIDEPRPADESGDGPPDTVVDGADPATDRATGGAPAGDGAAHTPSPSAWASQWFSPAGLAIVSLRDRGEGPTMAAKFGCDVLLDHRAEVIYFGALDDPAVRFLDDDTAAQVGGLAVEDQWRHRWAALPKQGANPPTIQHSTYEERALADGTIVRQQAFVTRESVTAEDYFGMEAHLLTTLSPAQWCSITGWSVQGQRRGERHGQAVCVYWADRQVPVSPHALAPAPAAQWVLAGRINEAFAKAQKLHRPETITARAMTSARSRNGHIWEVSLRLYGGDTLADVRKNAERIRQALGTPWLRVADSEDGCLLYLGVSPDRAELASERRDRARLVELDWDQAWLDGGVVSPNGLVPRLTGVDHMPNNTKVQVLTFTLPPGLDVYRCRAAVPKLKTSTGNVFVEIRTVRNDAGSITVLACAENPMPDRCAYDFDYADTVPVLPFATGVEGEPICFDMADSPHLLVAGTTGGGKSVTAQALLYGAIVNGADVAVIDPSKGAADFRFMQDHAVGFATSVVEAAAVMRAVYDEVVRRKDANSAAGVGSAKELPEPPRPVVVFIDEFTSLMAGKKPSTRPEDDPERETQRLERMALYNAQSDIGFYAGKIAREARSADVHLILATQKLTLKLLSDDLSDVKTNLARILLGKANQGERMSALRDPENAPSLGEDIPKGRGIWESLSAPAVTGQFWFATQTEFAAQLAARVAPLTDDRRLDLEPYLPQEGDDHTAAPSLRALPGPAERDVVTDVGEMEFSLDDLREYEDAEDPASEDDAADDDAEDHAAYPDGSHADATDTDAVPAPSPAEWPEPEPVPEPVPGPVARPGAAADADLWNGDIGFGAAAVPEQGTAVVDEPDWDSAVWGAEAAPDAGPGADATAESPAAAREASARRFVPILDPDDPFA